MMIIEINYYFQKKDKSLKIFTIKGLIELNNKIDYNNLEYPIYSKKTKINFSELTDPLTLLDEIKKGVLTLEMAKDNQKNFLSYLNSIRIGNKNVEQRKTLSNINMLYNARDSSIKFIEDYGSMILEAKRLAREREGTGANEMSRVNARERVKILTPNQTIKRLPIALAPIKAGNNSESLLNEIRLCIDQKKLLKKYTTT